jgi:hypothetical protein
VCAATLGALVASAPAHAQELVTTPAGDFSIQVPAAFVPVQLNPVAQLQYADSAETAFFIVIVEPKDDLFGWNLTRHSTITSAQIIAVTDFPEVRGPIETTVSGYPAVQYEVRGVAQGTQLVYLQSAVEAPHAFIQVLMWTLRSRWDSQEPVFRGALESIRIQPSGGVASPAPDLFGLITGTWVWEDGDEQCRESAQTFEFSSDRSRMMLSTRSPDARVTEYIVEGSGVNVLHTYIIDESRLTDTGVPVKWDLVMVAPDVMAWHRTDWQAERTTRRLVRCPGAVRTRA